MPGRLGVARPGLGGQGGLAVVADRRQIRHDLVDPFRREAMAMMSLMSRLPAWLATGRRLDDGFGGSGWIDRRRRGGVRGVAVQLSPQFMEFGL